ncbi:MAG: YciI family protein [Povalibacter sp.]|jgi:hypothetical protein
MRYMFLIYSGERGDGPQVDMEDLKQRHWALIDEATSKGVLEAAEPLYPASTATTVRQQDGKPLVIDGPFAETKEQLAGYYIIECKDLDEAIGWAKKIPSGCKGAERCVEIRPILGLPPR